MIVDFHAANGAEKHTAGVGLNRRTHSLTIEGKRPSLKTWPAAARAKIVRFWCKAHGDTEKTIELEFGFAGLLRKSRPKAPC